MADNPITVPLPQDLPQNWTYGQTIGPQGTDVGLTQQHGYNYLMQQVNAAQQAAQELGEAFSGLPTLGSDGKIPEDQLPPMNYDPVGSAETVQENLNAHVEDKENPHGVTYQQVGAAAESHIHDASAVVSGTFAAARIPGLDAGKITSGILSVARGGTGVSSLAALAAALNMPNIKLGYYIGSGNYGESSPCSVSADFAIRMMLIVGYADVLDIGRLTCTLTSSRPIMLTDEIPTSGFKQWCGPFDTGYGEYAYAKVSEDRRTLYWYNSYTESSQFNRANTQYYYLLFGGGGFS